MDQYKDQIIKQYFRYFVKLNKNTKKIPILHMKNNNHIKYYIFYNDDHGSVFYDLLLDVQYESFIYDKKICNCISFSEHEFETIKMKLKKIYEIVIIDIDDKLCWHIRYPTHNMAALVNMQNIGEKPFFVYGDNNKLVKNKSTESAILTQLKNKMIIEKILATESQIKYVPKEYLFFDETYTDDTQKENISDPLQTVERRTEKIFLNNTSGNVQTEELCKFPYSDNNIDDYPDNANLAVSHFKHDPNITIDKTAQKELTDEMYNDFVLV